MENAKLISLESLLNRKRISITHGIGDTYKDSEEALYEKEGNEDADVEVIDRRKDTGEIIHYIWDKRKSNANVTDTRFGKLGFSFYFARYVYRDPYKVECPEEATDPNNTAYVGILEERRENESVLVVIQTRLESAMHNHRIRIISAYYKDNRFLYRRYINNLRSLLKRGVVPGYTVEWEDSPPDQLKRAWEGYHRRQVAFEDAWKNHNL
jgi:uncharacterized DUF497 family protein